MGEVVSTQILSEPTGSMPPTPTPEVPARPSWLPEKFKTEADLVRSYQELERKLSSTAKPAPAPTGKTVLPTTPVTSTPNVDANTSEVTPEVAKAAEELVKGAGLDMAALQAEYTAQGDLSPESKKLLSEAGISDQMVDVYKRGMEAQRSDYENKILDGVSSREDFSKALEWASTQLSVEETEAFNKAMAGGDPLVGKLAAKGLMADYKKSLGPQLISGNPSSSKPEGFDSRAQQIAAMNDPRYKTDPAYRDMVARKSVQSNF